MPRPSEDYLWAESAAAEDISDPNVERPGGYKFKQDLPNSQFNYLLRAHGRWIDWLAGQTDDYDTPAEAFDVADDWQRLQAVHKGDEAPGEQMTTGNTAFNLGGTASVASSAYDGRYFWVRDTSSGLEVKQVDSLDDSVVATYSPGWAAGTIERIGTNGAYLVIAGNDTSASVRKATVIDLSDGSTIATVNLTTSLAGGGIQHVRVGHTYAWVARTADATDTHDATRITLTDGTASNVALLSYGTTDSPRGFDIDDDFVYVGDALNEEVFVYQHDGSTLVATLTPTNASFNVQDLRVVDGRVFVVYETGVGSAPMVLACFTSRGELVGEYELDGTLTDFMLAVDKEFVYGAIGNASGSSITIHALRVRDFSLAWLAPMDGIVGSDYEQMWSDGLYLWADTNSAQVRRFATSKRVTSLMKIPAGARGQARAMMMTEV